jgi:DNA modification methylase
MPSKIELVRGECVEVLKRLELDPLSTVFVSDPPFNIGYHYKTYKDKIAQENYDEMLRDVFSGRRHVLIHYPEALYRHAIQIQEPPTRVVSWVYNSNTPRQHRDVAFFGVSPDFKKIGQDYKNPNDKRIAKRIAAGKKARLYDWWEVNQVKNVNRDKTAHPCQMPLEIMRRVIGVLPDDVTIVDPFMGSGTTGVAAVKSGRNFIGIELEDEYFNIASQRLTEALDNEEPF